MTEIYGDMISAYSNYVQWYRYADLFKKIRLNMTMIVQGLPLEKKSYMERKTIFYSIKLSLTVTIYTS